MKYELGKTSKQVSNYVEKLGEKRNARQLKEDGLQCVVSDYAIMHWYAQAFKLDVNNMETLAPDWLKHKPLSGHEGRDISAFD